MDTSSSSSQPSAQDSSSQFVSKRLTLTLPPSRNVSRTTIMRSTKGKTPFQTEPTAPKLPRPVKLKPLKEVLTKLINQIKKKDDYAFFLQPVDMSQVPGYTDVIKNPMDFGTMSGKVDKGRYRSLEEFTADFRLVTSNARTFNPPATVFHTEAARIEAWGLEQISRASAHVIEYETDWNIDVVADEDPAPLANGDMEDNNVKDAATRVKSENDDARSLRSPSVLSTAPGQAGPSEKVKRGPKPQQKKIPGVISESIDADGRLPGSKDGVGAFPPGSDLAELMLVLKLKGKRYKTKKERMRVEKEGLPHLTDGSLDYFEMEDPFSIFQALVPDPPTQPHLFPVLPTDPSDSTPQSPSLIDKDQSMPIPAPINIPFDALPAFFPPPNRTAPPNVTPSAGGKKRPRHWTIVRNPPARSRNRDGDESQDAALAARPYKKPRVAEATDYGVFQTLPGCVAAELGISADNFARMLGNETQFLEALRRCLQKPPALVAKGSKLEKILQTEGRDMEAVFEAEEYLRDIVYGGVDGLAYVRSVAEFVSGPTARHEHSAAEAFESDIEQSEGLGMPLARWVESHIIDPLTSGNHTVLRDAARSLVHPLKQSPTSPIHEHLRSAMQDTPALEEHLRTLRGLSDTDAQIDMVPLLHALHELFEAEEEWAGAAFKAEKEKEREAMESALVRADAAGFLAYAIESHSRAELGVGMGTGTGMATPRTAVGDSAEVIDHALVVGADGIIEMDRRVRSRAGCDETLPADGGDGEDPALRKLRLNLLAVAKRAPLDKIAKLPAELVPPHIRHIVPTLSS